MSALLQTSLFDDQDHSERFFDFHRQNPEVYRLFERYALEAARRKRNYGARAIMERVRWDVAITTKGSDFKINNNHIPFYARMFMQAHKEYDGFFKTRGRA